MTAFAEDTYKLGNYRLGRLTPTQAETLSALVGAIDPWKTLGSTQENLAPYFLKSGADLTAWGVFDGEEIAGVVVIKPNWLLGPYLALIAILPRYKNTGIGKSVMGWMEEQARTARARNLFLCVSGFNHTAQGFYAKLGFEEAGHLPGLIIDDQEEILMRKRLHY